MMSALLLAGGILITSGLPSAAVPLMQPQPSKTVISQKPKSDRLPSRISRRVIRYAANELGIARRNLSIVSATSETWSDGCLGVPSPVELCLAALTPGWRVELTDGNKTWFYRTNANGEYIRQEPQPEQPTDPGQSDRISEEATTRILEQAARDAGVSVKQLGISAVESRVWDGCYGISTGPDNVCTMIAIFGWRAVVTDGQKVLIYHTNQDATEIRLNEMSSQLQGEAVVPSFLSEAERTANPGDEVVFQSIASGGFAGQTRQIMLMNDGRVVSLLVGETIRSAPQTIRQLSPQEVERFVRQIQELGYGNFVGLDYPAPAGAADYFTVSLSTLNGTLRYTDANSDQLPSNLREIIATWNRISR